MLSFRPVQLGEMASGGGTPRAEALLEERRRLLRNALKGEFIRKKYNPVNYSADGGHVFDAAVQRWHALQFTYGDHFKPTLGNFAKFSLVCVFPIIGMYQLAFGPYHKEYLRMIARGEVSYKERKSQWFSN